MQIAKFFIDGPILCAIFSAFVSLFWFVGREVRIRHQVGDPHPLFRAMVIWWLNTVWEWSRFLKFYALKWDVKVTYPLLFLITMLLALQWIIGLLRELQAKGGSREGELAKDMRGATIFLLTLLTPATLAARIKEEKLYLLILPIALAILLAFYSLVVYGTFDELLRYIGIGLLFGAVLEAAAWSLVLLTGHEAQKGSLKDQLLSEAAAIEDRTELLREKIKEFEAIALLKFHAISGEANHEFTIGRRILERFDARLDGLSKLLTQDQEPALIAARKLLDTDIDIRENFVDNLIVPNQVTHITKGEWLSTLEREADKLERLLAPLRGS